MCFIAITWSHQAVSATFMTNNYAGENISQDFLKIVHIITG